MISDRCLTGLLYTMMVLQIIVVGHRYGLIVAMIWMLPAMIVSLLLTMTLGAIYISLMRLLDRH